MLYPPGSRVHHPYTSTSVFPLPAVHYGTNIVPNASPQTLILPPCLTCARTGDNGGYLSPLTRQRCPSRIGSQIDLSRCLFLFCQVLYVWLDYKQRNAVSSRYVFAVQLSKGLSMAWIHAMWCGILQVSACGALADYSPDGSAVTATPVVLPCVA